MATNQYFRNFTSPNEQDLYEDLIIESIQMYGHDVLYLPRRLQKEDLIFGEDVISKFEDVICIEMYVKNVDNWEGEGDFLSKFGLEIRDQGTLTTSIKRFKQEVCRKDLEDLLERPREGDLIWFPLTKHLLEVKFVEHEDVFYQNGKLKVYDIKVEKFEYSHEDLETGVEEIDAVEETQSYSLQLTLGAGTGAYEVGEPVYQGPDLLNATAKAEVASYASGASTVTIREIVGEFNLTDQLIGDTSGASYTIGVLNTQVNVNDDLDDSFEIELEADAVIDFTENNPFSEEPY